MASRYITMFCSSWALTTLVGCTSSSPSAPAPSPQQNEQELAKTTPVPSKGACFAITNGVQTTSYTSVVPLAAMGGKAYCTGVFVSSTTLLTAAHCIDTSPTGGLTLMSTGVAPTKVFHQGNVGDDSQLIHEDFAVAVFPAGSAVASVKVSTRPVMVGDAFFVVGVGNTVVSTDGGNQSNSSQQTYVGQNQVYVVNDNGILSYGESGVKPTSAAGTHSQSGNGDSGGPVLINGDVVGTVSQGDPLSSDDIDNAILPAMGNVDLTAMTNAFKADANLAWDINVNLTSPANQAYLKSLVAQGVAIDFGTGEAASAIATASGCSD